MKFGPQMEMKILAGDKHASHWEWHVEPARPFSSVQSPPHCGMN